MPRKVLLAIMPHPDDESLGFGGTLAKYGDNPDVQTYLVTLTRGEKGQLGEKSLGATRKNIGKIREKELRCAAGTLGVEKLQILNYQDGELPIVDEKIGITAMVRLINKIKPQVIITFGPDGGYGHPDHVALSHWVTQAVKLTPSVKKLYYMAITKNFAKKFTQEFGHIDIDGEKLIVVSHNRSYINAIIDFKKYSNLKFKALHCHKTQLKDVKHFEKLRDLKVKSMITHDYYHLAFARGEYKKRETDLFEGI